MEMLTKDQIDMFNGCCFEVSPGVWYGPAVKVVLVYPRALDRFGDNWRGQELGTVAHVVSMCFKLLMPFIDFDSIIIKKEDEDDEGDADLGDVEPVQGTAALDQEEESPPEAVLSLLCRNKDRYEGQS